MEEFRSYLAKKYGAEAAKAVSIQLPVTAGSLREAEKQAASIARTLKTSEQKQLKDRSTLEAPASAASSFRAHAISATKKPPTQNDLWSMIGKFERMHFERENERLAEEARDRKSEYRAQLDAQMRQLHARRHSELVEKNDDMRRIQEEQRQEKNKQDDEKQKLKKEREELRVFIASERERKAAQLAKRKLREKLERQRILEIMASECEPGAEVQAPRLKRKIEDPRAPWEKEDAPKEGDVRKFCEGLDAQIKEKREEMKREEKIRELEKQALDGDAAKAKAEAAEERARRIQARKQVDTILIKQINELLPLSKDERMNLDGKNKDLLVNQPLVRMMAEEAGFLKDEEKRKLLKCKQTN